MSFRALWRGSLENPYTYLLLLFFAYTIFKRLWCWCMYPRVFIYLLSTQEQQKDRKKLRRCACVRVGEWIKEISSNIHFTKTCQVRAGGCDGNEALQIKCTSWDSRKKADRVDCYDDSIEILRVISRWIGQAVDVETWRSRMTNITAIIWSRENNIDKIVF